MAKKNDILWAIARIEARIRALEDMIELCDIFRDQTQKGLKYTYEEELAVQQQTLGILKDY